MAQKKSISLDNHFAESRLASLRSALADGEASGAPEPFDFDAFIAAKKA